MSKLTPESRIIKAIEDHLSTGISFSAYHLTPEEKMRIDAVFHLYNVWRKNMLVDKKVFLQYVHHRSTHDIIGDLYCFEYIKNRTNDMLMSKDDILILQQQAILEGLQAARQNGDGAALLKAADKLAKLRDSMPENNVQMHQELDDFYTTDVQKIAPDFIPVSGELRRQLTSKYGGKQDTNSQQVEDKTAALLSIDETDSF